MRPPPQSLGHFHPIFVPSPATGKEYNYTIPYIGHFLIRHLYLKFTTVGGIGDRYITLIFLYHSNPIFAVSSGGLNQSPGMSYDYFFYQGATLLQDVTQAKAYVPFPPRMYISDSFTIQSQTMRLQGNDHFDALTIFTSYWPYW